MPTRGSNKAARLLHLVAQLEAGPRTAADLARQLGVSQRTLQRDLEELPEIGHAVERDGRRYRLRAGSTTLDPVEALAVHSATRLLVHHTRVNERGYRTALTKLANQLPEPARAYLHASVTDIETLSSEGPSTTSPKPGSKAASCASTTARPRRRSTPGAAQGARFRSGSRLRRPMAYAAGPMVNGRRATRGFADMTSPFCAIDRA